MEKDQNPPDVLGLTDKPKKKPRVYPHAGPGTSFREYTKDIETLSRVLREARTLPQILAARSLLSESLAGMDSRIAHLTGRYVDFCEIFGSPTFDIVKTMEVN